MKVVIVYSADVNYISPFVRKLLEQYPGLVTAVIQTQGSIIRRKTRLQQLDYLAALLLILGLRRYVSTAVKTVYQKMRQTDGVEAYCSLHNIPFRRVKSINSPETITYLKSLDCDVILNQSQHIVKKAVLDIPRIGVLNRHGAPLPNYKGRLAPFWQLLNNEAYGGLTYHLLDEGIDTGPIVYQQLIPIEANDDVNSLIEKMFTLAVERFGHVLEILARPDAAEGFIRHPPTAGSYYSSPRLKDALAYRLRHWRGKERQRVS